jgi:hypothetical protein
MLLPGPDLSAARLADVETHLRQARLERLARYAATCCTEAASGILARLRRTLRVVPVACEEAC